MCSSSSVVVPSYLYSKWSEPLLSAVKIRYSTKTVSDVSISITASDSIPNVCAPKAHCCDRFQVPSAFRNERWALTVLKR